MRTADAFYSEIDELCPPIDTMDGPVSLVADKISEMAALALGARGKAVTVDEVDALEKAAMQFVAHNYIEKPLGSIKAKEAEAPAPKVAAKPVEVASDAGAPIQTGSIELNEDSFYSIIEGLGLHVQIMTGAPSVVAARIVKRVVDDCDNRGPSSAVREEDMGLLEDAAARFVANNYVEKEFIKRHRDTVAHVEPKLSAFERGRKWLEGHPRTGGAFSLLIIALTLGGLSYKANYMDRQSLTEAVRVDADATNKEIINIVSLADGIKNRGLYIQSSEVTEKLVEAVGAIGTLRADGHLSFESGVLSRDAITRAQNAVQVKRDAIKRISSITTALYFQRQADDHYRQIESDGWKMAIINNNKAMVKSKRVAREELENWQGWAANDGLKALDDKIAQAGAPDRLKTESRALINTFAHDPLIERAVRQSEWPLEKMNALIDNPTAPEAEVRAMYSFLVQIHRSVSDDLAAVKNENGRIIIINTAGAPTAALLAKKDGGQAGFYTEAILASSDGSFVIPASDAQGVVARKAAGTARFILVDSLSAAILVAP